MSFSNNVYTPFHVGFIHQKIKGDKMWYHSALWVSNVVFRAKQDTNNIWKFAGNENSRDHFPKQQTADLYDP